MKIAKPSNWASKMKPSLILLLTLLLGCMATSKAAADVRVNIGLPVLQINLGVQAYPELIAIPDYPVYYAPHLQSNYFFYDGLYWVYEADDWYASSWYNGPWASVDRYAVPVFILRIPVRYYRHAPRYFRGWHADAPPRWDDHWGSTWHERRKGWDRRDRKSYPKRPPLPDFQREYSGDRYPSTDRQRELRDQNYHYQPREQIVREHLARDRSTDARRQNEQHSNQIDNDSRDDKDKSRKEQHKNRSERGGDDRQKHDKHH